MADPITPGEFYRLMDLDVMIEDDQYEITQHFKAEIDDLVAIVDAEFELVCFAPKDKAPTLVKILNASAALVDRSAQ